jgi:hypothetical protein
MRHGQKVKVISATGGLFEGREQEIRCVALKWIRRLRSTVNYDLTGKMFVFEEVGPGEEVQDGLLQNPDMYARVNGQCDAKGKWLPTDGSRDADVRRGNYSLVLIELLASHWPRFSASLLEDNIVHELLHVIRPQIGRAIKNGDLVEDEDYMHKTTRKLIKNFERMSKSDKHTILKELITDADNRNYMRSLQPNSGKERADLELHRKDQCYRIE